MHKNNYFSSFYLQNFFLDTAPNGGVSLEYSHGSHCSNGGAQHQTTLILECDRNTEYAVSNL